jgi:hypothetical protein
VRIQWIRSIAEKAGLIAAALLTVSALTSCGGGGVAALSSTASGALLVLPGTADVFPNTPVTFTVSGGKPGYRVFSGNSTVIALDTQVSGASFTVVANDVSTDTPVTITVSDSANATATTTANVRVAVLNNLATLTPLAPLAGCGDNTVCSGGDAQVTVTAIQNGIKLRNRPILFSVYQGQFQFVTPISLALVNSITVNTDENGLALAKLTVTSTVPTQVATLTMTDATTGLVKYFNFNIVQQTSGEGILSTLPSGSTTFTGGQGAPGSTEGLCPVGSVDYYIFGGTPPYRVASPLPSLITVSTPIVTVNGGSVTATIFGCGASQLLVTDATSRTVETSQIIGVRGPAGTAPPTPVTPTAPTVNPPVITLNNCGEAVTVILGGTTPISNTIPTAEGGAAIAVLNGATSATITRRATGSPSPTPPTPITVNFSNSAGTVALTVTLAGPAAAACP